VSFMGRDLGQYIAQDMRVPQLPDDAGSPLRVPFRIASEHSQVLVLASNFTYVESIQLFTKDSNSMVKSIDGTNANSISEVLAVGDYYLQFNYKAGGSGLTDKTQVLGFGISDYRNVQKYKL